MFQVLRPASPLGVGSDDWVPDTQRNVPMSGVEPKPQRILLI